MERVVLWSVGRPVGAVGGLRGCHADASLTFDLWVWLAGCRPDRVRCWVREGGGEDVQRVVPWWLVGCV